MSKAKREIDGGNQMSLGVVHFCPVILYKMGLQSKCEVADGWKRERSVPARPGPAQPRSAQAIRLKIPSLAWRPLPPCGWVGGVVVGGWVGAVWRILRPRPWPTTWLWRRVKKAKDPIEKHRFLAVYHAKRGLTAKEIAKITLSSIRWVQETVRRYNREGPEGLRDKRHQNPGQKPKLTPEEQRRVLEALQGPPPDGGLWTGPKLRDWVERELGKKLSLYPIYRLLHEMGFALRVPRPRHAKADGEAQEAFKKTSPPRSRRRGPRGGR